MRGDRQGLHARRLIARDREAGAADAKLAGDPAGDQAAQRTHRPIGRKRRRGRIASGLDPAIELVRATVEAQRLVPFSGPLGQRPAQVVVGRVQVEPDPDQDTGSPSGPRVPSCVVERLGRDPQHERLLGQHLAQLPGRNPELADRKLERIDVVTGEFILTSPRSGRPGFAELTMAGDRALKKGLLALERTTWAAMPTIATRGEAPADIATWPPTAVGKSEGAAAGTHSSISTWALIPPKPKPLTAARRGRPVAGSGQGSARVRTRNGLSSSPSRGAAASKLAVGGKLTMLEAPGAP